MSKHTPTLWEIQSWKPATRETPYYDIFTPDGVKIASYIANKAIAEFIVRACYNHDGLVEALSKCRTYIIRNCVDTLGKENILKETQQVLAKAKEA